MGRKSTKKNKNIYFRTREERNYPSRAAAAEALNFDESKLEKIENDRVTPHPEEVLRMAKVYKAPLLCNYYCSKDCQIGQEYVPEVKCGNVHEILVKMLVSLDNMNGMKARLMQILEDGEVQAEEQNDFIQIQKELEQISLMVESLQLRVESAKAKEKE